MTGVFTPLPDPAAFAALICDWCLQVAPGERVLVDSTTLAEALALELHAAILDRDAWPFVRLTPPGLGADFYRHAGERHQTQPPPIELGLLQSLDALVRIDAPANTTELADIDPALIARVAGARRELQEASLAKRWCGHAAADAGAGPAGWDGASRIRGLRQPGAVPGYRRSGGGLAGAERPPGPARRAPERRP